MPRASVRPGQPVHESRELIVIFRPQHEVKVCRHQAEHQQPDWDAAACLIEQPLELRIVGGGVKQPLATDAAIEDVEDEAPGSSSRSSGHAPAASIHLPTLEKGTGYFSQDHEKSIPSPF
jgi:hypothetical protein